MRIRIETACGTPAPRGQGDGAGAPQRSDWRDGERGAEGEGNSGGGNGRANHEVCEVLAAYLGVAKRNVEVMLGHASPQKRLRIVL